MPSQQILKRYSDILIKFALNSGKGVKPGEVVFIQLSESAKEMLLPLQTSVLEAGGHPIIQYNPDSIDKNDSLMRNFYETANDEQLSFFAEKYMLARVDQCDHFVMMLSTNNKYELQGIDSAKIMTRNKAFKPYMDARVDKENKGNLTWTLGLFGTQAMAEDVNMSLEEYWDQIIKACYLDEEDPISKWKQIFSEVETTRAKLNALQIEKVHMVGEDVDLHIKLGTDRQWLGGSGRNIPSFEVFISPDWRGTSGWIRFNQPLYRYGNRISGIELHFVDGVITKASAKENEQLLLDMIAVENANKVGEYSLTDKRLSRITKYMGETLYDENVGGEFGNTHLALGFAYPESFIGNVATVSKTELEDRGFNDSAVHTDIMSTTNRTVTAHCADGSTKVIYKDGMFTLE